MEMSADELESFEERAAILEFDAGLCREWAERIAARMVLERRAKRTSSTVPLVADLQCLDEESASAHGAADLLGVARR